MKKKIKGKYDSKLEVRLAEYWHAHVDKSIVAQYKFHPVRSWRFDFAFPELYIAIEIQGFGTGHTSYTGMQRDYEKHNSAMAIGWGIVYLMSSDLTQVRIKSTIHMITSILETRQGNHHLLEGIKKLNDKKRATIHKKQPESVNFLDEARRALRERFD